MTTGTPVFDRKGKIFRVVSNVRDITELMLLKQQLDQAQGLSKHYESELRALQIQYSGCRKAHREFSEDERSAGYRSPSGPG